MCFRKIERTEDTREGMRQIIGRLAPESVSLEDWRMFVQDPFSAATRGVEKLHDYFFMRPLKHRLQGSLGVNYEYVLPTAFLRFSVGELFGTAEAEERRSILRLFEPL